MSPVEEFDPRGPLPEGLFSIEASAGTGKTHTITTLALRYLLEWGLRPQELLIVTFTRAATAELRSRVRDRLSEAHHFALGESLPPHSDAELLEQLLGAPAGEEREQRRAALETALAELDSATISTIHGFATQVRSALGATSGLDLDAETVEDTPGLLEDVCADLITERALAGLDAAQLEVLRKALPRSARYLQTIPDLAIAPPAGDRSDLALLAELARQACEQSIRRRRLAGTLSFDDVLTTLRDALSSATEGPGTIELLRSRYRVALIDEFQDTDPVQWAIFSRLFDSSSCKRALVLVGDPKQAIYAFRGADLATYLRATRTAGVERRQLTQSWRCDENLLAALGSLLEGATFGDPSIGYTAVSAAPGRAAPRLLDRAGDPLPALRLRLALDGDLPRSKRSSEEILVEAARDCIFEDLAHRVQDLLEGAVLRDDDPVTAGGRQRSLRPGDVAVLTEKWSDAISAAASLRNRGIPAVLARAGSVLDSPAAEQWKRLLAALARPAHEGLARSAALTWFLGWSAEQLDGAGEAEISALHRQLHDWAEVLAERGVVELVQRVLSDHQARSQALQLPDGDRDVTDLDHIGELLCLRAGPIAAAPAELLAILEDAGDAEEPADAESAQDQAARRIESDADAVQLMTIHNAKGLEFPVVCCPTLWTKPNPTRPIYTATSGARLLSLEGDTSESKVEAVGEQLRLLYVALTRARHHLVVWYSRSRDTPSSPLARLLFARDEACVIDADQLAAGGRIALAPNADVPRRLAPLAERSRGRLRIEELREVVPASRSLWSDPEVSRASGELRTARFDRRLDRGYRRWSFSAMTQRIQERWLDPHDESLADHGATDEGGAALDDLDASTPSPQEHPLLPLDDLPAGTAFGTLVHEVLEAVDFTSTTLREDLDEALTEALRRQPVRLAAAGEDDAGARALLGDGLLAAIETPLGPIFEGLSLREVPRSHRLDELSFELHLGSRGVRARDRDLGELLLGFLDPGDPLHAWAASLARGVFGIELAGHLTGSIDAVLRDPRRPDQPRYLVVDYKSNRLGPAGRRLTPADYDSSRLATAMAHHHYPLQALLYLVALHRYLRWRQHGYSPEAHLAGAAYLFVRGMTGPRAASGAGVFAWPLAAAAVVAASDLLGGEISLEGAGSR